MQPGSGKTAAFCFPIIASMLMSNYEPTRRGSRKATPYALILAPTRELTSQIYDESRKFSFNTGIRPVSHRQNRLHMHICCCQKLGPCNSIIHRWLCTVARRL